MMTDDIKLKIENTVKNEEGKVDIYNTVCGMAMKSPNKKKLAGLNVWKHFPLLWIPLYISYKCTRRCSYCYAHTQNGTNLEMTDDLFDRLVWLIPELHHKTNVLNSLVVFLGGEPLLRTDRIKRIVDNIYDKTTGMGLSLFTNGDLLDKVNWGDLQRIHIWNVNICDTSLSEVERRMKIIKQNAKPQNQSVVATFDEFNMVGNRMEEFTRFAIENNYRPRYYNNIYAAKDKIHKKELIKKYHKILDICEEKQELGYNIHPQFMLNQLMPYDWENLHPDFSPYLCGRGIVSVKANGTISPCLRAQEEVVSTISDSPEHILNSVKDRRFKITYNRVGASEECKICEVKDVCFGGCPYDRLLTYGNLNGKDPWCEVTKAIVPRLMKLWHVKNKDLLERIS